MADWQSRLTDAEREALENVRDKQIERGPDITPREATQFAIDHLFQREDVVTERKLRKTAVHYGIGYVMPEEVDREIAGGAGARRDHGERRQEGAAFRKDLQPARSMQNDAAGARGQGTMRAADDGVSGRAGIVDRSKTPPRVWWRESRDRYVGLRGPAGTGKSYSIKAVAAVIDERKARGEENLSRALALAPSSSASRGELRKAGFKDATTLAAFFESEKLPARNARPAADRG